MRSETDFGLLHATRVTAEIAELIEKQGNRFILTPAGKRLSTSSARIDIYERLFRAFVLDLNWAYLDRVDGLKIIQGSAFFTLYLLSRNGRDWVPMETYADWFLQAFPMVIREAEDLPHVSSADVVDIVYVMRAIQSFAIFFGLAESDFTNWHQEGLRVRKLPLLDQLFTFHARQ